MGEHTPRWRIGLQADPLTIHTWSIWCGLSMLRVGGTIELHHVARALPAERSVWIEAYDRETDRVRTVCIDINDFGTYSTPLRTGLADSTWKRGYESGPARPLGLVAPMRSGAEPRGRYLAAALAAAGRTGRPSRARPTVSGLLPRRAPPLYSAYESGPGGAEQVLFQVRAWEPEMGQSPQDRRDVNESRAAVIRGLAGALGARFVGGFLPTPYAREIYPDLISDLPTDRNSYLGLVRSCAVAVSTIGLHGSNPWKLVEYLAASRAIVTEPLRYAVPESLDGTVAVFDGFQQCVDRCVELLDSADRRAEMQVAAHDYWRHFVRPDQLLLRRLREEFGGPDVHGAHTDEE